MPNQCFKKVHTWIPALWGEAGYEILPRKMLILSLMVTDTLSLRSKMCSMSQFQPNGCICRGTEAVMTGKSNYGCEPSVSSFIKYIITWFLVGTAKSFLFSHVLIAEHLPNRQRSKLSCFMQQIIYGILHSLNLIYSNLNVTATKEINHKVIQFNF